MAFEAKYPGRCGNCDGDIREGDEARFEGDELVHDHCPREAPACPACWTIHAGECF